MQNRINTLIYKALLGLLPAVALLSTAPTAIAQDAGAAAVLDEITVTARRREETLREVPIAVSAFPASNSRKSAWST